jgi:hypothetical protein
MMDGRENGKTRIAGWSDDEGVAMETPVLQRKPITLPLHEQPSPTRLEARFRRQHVQIDASNGLSQDTADIYIVAACWPPRESPLVIWAL